MRLALSCLFLASTLAAFAAGAQPYSGPIIDVHLHVGAAAPGAPNPATGEPTTANTDADRERLTLERMRKHGIVLGLVSGPDAYMASMRKAGGDAIWAGAFLDDGHNTLPPPEVLRAAFESGELKVMGEIGAQYHGLDPGDPWFEPYLALAEEFDIPVGIHTGLAPPGTPYGCCPDFSVELGNPKLLEPVLKRHPKLRLWLMHAGWPYLQETKALLYMYPQLHADVSVIDWIIPRQEFHDYLQALMTAGFGDRLMFGSDQMIWPEAISLAVEGVDSASFLTPAQKRAIFHDNAARFLKLPPAVD
ncbi:amidohydrolase family protein [Luteimonas sp. 8-5]|uniref:amidohydrolase family protein n=1 Tax=Luteimonas sp. 8-5 TaxID=3039387 RepID=UPI00243654DA|nr:amidohydrolase family protein [Luteimonas sp. 8-5]MDG6347518.1 amidohydrolase family protein [Luteimonas sp. 8-5]